MAGVWICAAASVLAAGCHSFGGGSGSGGVTRDNNILALAVELNTGQIALTHEVAGRTRFHEVGRFADRLNAQHSSFDEQLRRLPVAAPANSLTREFAREGQRLAEVVRSASALAVDRAYLDATISMHETSIRLLDQSMILQAERETLRQVLRRMHAAMKANLRMAQDLRGRTW
ncbi:MAG: DUF4142 domain-containing protein [Gemmatimonadota bacterium]